MTAMRSATRPEAAVFCAEVASWPRPEAAASAMRRFFRARRALRRAGGGGRGGGVHGGGGRGVGVHGRVDGVVGGDRADDERATAGRRRADTQGGRPGRVRDAAHAADIVVATLRGMRTALV